MTEFPIKALKHTIDHSGGTKSFHLYILTHEASGRSLFITRWGKTGAFGQVKVDQREDWGAALRAFQVKLEEKEKGGYRGGPIGSTVSCPAQSNLTGYISPQLTSTISPRDWAWLKTGNDTSESGKTLSPADQAAQKRHEDRLQEQADKAERDAKARAELEEKLRLQREEEHAKAQQEIPNWGRF